MSENRIRRVAIKRITSAGQIDIRAEAEVTGSEGAVQVVTSSGVQGIPSGADAVNLREMEDTQLSELRKRLYAAGYSKRAIATAVKDVVRVESRGH
jgi:delta-aminolevulinic acid dehydratase/porphobilinogen synthase